MSEIEDDKIKVKFLRRVWLGITSFFSTPPRYVWLGVPFLLIALSIAIYLAACKGEWVGLSPILLAAAAFPIVLWRMGLLDEQIKIADKNIEIQQQVGHRQNYFASIEYLEDKSPTLRRGAIEELGGQLETDKERHSRIIKILSSVLRENTIQENDTEENIENKKIIIQTTLDALAKQKPKWFPSDFKLDLSGITFNKNPSEIFLTIKNLKGASLSVANFENTDIPMANLERASLQGANFTEVDFTGDLLYGDNFENTPVPGANFKEAKLYKATFKKATLWRADFEGADLQQANFTKADLWRADFKQAVCNKTKFEEASLCSADLSQATGITQKQINFAFGDAATKLPPDLKMPHHWSPIELERWLADDEWEKWRAELAKASK